MELELISEKENPLFGRKEVVVSLPVTESTPSRKTVLELMSKKFGNSEKLIFIGKIEHPFGTRKAKIYARLYSDEKAAAAEHAYVQVRGTGKKQAHVAGAKKEKKA